MEKSVLLSKTFYLGLLTAIAPLFPAVGTFVSENVSLVASAWGLLTIVLRFLTKDKVVLLP